MQGRHLSAVVVAGVAGLGVAGCGIDTKKAGDSAQVSTTPTMPQTTTAPSGRRRARTVLTPAQRRARMPSRPANTIAIEGGNDALSRTLQNRAARSSHVTATFARTNDTRSYADLCSGKVDVIQTSAAPTTADYEMCSRNGVTIRPPATLGADAVVLATKNESDVGGDCITVQQARDIFRTGSPYSNWSQLGFFDIPLRTTGRESGSDNFRFFGFEVLGLSDATLSDVRSDYIPHSIAARERAEVTNEARNAAATRRVAAYRARLISTTQGDRRRYVDAAVKRADRQVLRDIARINRRNKRLKINVDGRALARANARKDRDAKRRASLEANARYDAKLTKRLQAYQSRVAGTANRSGTVGPFSFSYYELFEDQLRPLEIDYGAPETTSGTPVRFGDLTQADKERLAPQVVAAQQRLAAQRQRAGGASSATVTRQTFRSANASTARGRRALAASIDPQTTLNGVSSSSLPQYIDGTSSRAGRQIYPGPNCVFPSQLTITNGAYPLTRRIFYVTTDRGALRAPVRRFVQNVLENAQAEAGNERIVPVTDAQLAAGYDSFGITRPSNLRSTSAAAQQSAGTPAQTTPTTTTAAPPTRTTTRTTATAPTPAPPAAGQSTGIPGVSARGDVP